MVFLFEKNITISLEEIRLKKCSVFFSRLFLKIVVTPISSILIGFSIINHPFWGTTILGTPKWRYGKIC